MDCRSFEANLEALTVGSLAAEERAACEQHAAACASCGELRDLAELKPVPVAETRDLVASVLARTSGPACSRAQQQLPDFVDGSLEPSDRELVEHHAQACRDCRELVLALRVLAVELPRLAELRPDRRFASDVLAATLPVGVQLRRWWSRVWPEWVRRPRFASEVAYVGLLVIVVLFATPGSPLADVPQQALQVAQSAPNPHIDLPVDEVRARIASATETIRNSDGVQAALELGAAGAVGIDRAEEAASDVGRNLGTFWERLASMLGRADGESASDPQDTNEETP